MKVRKLSRGPRHHRGFTLVELMVALTLGLFLIIGLISLIVSTISTRSELDKSSRQIENGRYALELLSEDIQAAGFIGRTGSTAFNPVLPIACPTNIASLGYSAATNPGTSSVPLPIYGPSAAPSCVSNVMVGTAMLVVVRVSTNPVLAPASAVATETYLQVSACGTDTVPFAIASGASTASFNLMSKDCVSSKPAPLRKVVQHLYYVSTCNVCGTDTTPTLKMAEYVNGAMTITPLVEGIENLQFDYGIDIDGNGSPDCYTSNPTSPPLAEIATSVCPQTTPPYDWTIAANNWGNVMAVRIHVLARSTEGSAGWTDKRNYDLGLAVPAAGPFNDQIKRHVYSTVARLYNISGQREAP
ncbi:Tfp pilus assembly protein PilW [Variovorax sp. SRS16]|uniref:PilW family protein n=1 Tax=Variovorax sp. SRS16 TaxID=282217 RepID=UPI0013181EAC|nr:PilW family protein [Variovorax sp. SRS16]VTU16773.1 Tfp pilus assembly protein PilW [Variovorax sp. SRS16]